MKKILMTAMIAGLMAFAASATKADPVTFTTTGAFSASGGATSATFTNMFGTSTLTFTGTTNSINTPVGTSFGDILSSSTVAAGMPGPAIGGTFTLTITQISPPGGPATLTGTLSGNFSLDSGIATLTFSTTSTSIGIYTYTVNPVYTIAVPVTGTGGGAIAGTTTLQGTVTGSAVPEPTSMMLLGTGLLGVAGAARRRFKKNK